MRSDLGTAALTREVLALRCRLDADAWDGPRCPELVGSTYPKADREAGKPPPFDHARAHRLYKALFGQAVDLIKGKQLLNVRAPARAVLLLPVEGDHVAAIGENRKLIVFPLRQVAVMSRGSGVRLQRYRDGGISDARVFRLEDGLTWTDTSGRTWTVAKADLGDWLGNRGDAGRLPPKGFPKSNRFS